jgi:hypothetical protein
MQITTTSLRRALRWAGGLLGAALLAMIVMHVPPVRGWLAARGHTGGALCPLGYTAGGAAETPEVRRARHAAARGDSPAQSRPALGFALDVTRAADLERWGASHGVRCTPRRGGTAVECADVPGGLLPGAGDLALTSVWFQLGQRGTLEAIRTVRRDSDVGAVASAFEARERTLTAQAGTPARRDGSAAPDVLANGMLRQALVEYRFTDYRAVVRATNMGDGYVLTEEYATLVD